MSYDQIARAREDANDSSTANGPRAQTRTASNFNRFASRVLARIPPVGAAVLAISSALVSGPASADAATYGWAKVSSTGKLLAESGVTGAVRFGNGRYNLVTSFNISECALTGTVNTTGGSDPGPGSGSILVSAVNADTLFVRTATPSATGAATVDSSRPFSIWIACR